MKFILEFNYILFSLNYFILILQVFQKQQISIFFHMLISTALQYLSMIYLIGQLNVCFMQPKIRSAITKPSQKLEAWNKSLEINSSIMPILLMLIIIFGFVLFSQTYHPYFFLGSCLTLISPLVTLLLGNVHQIKSHLFLIRNTYEVERKLTKQQADTIQQKIKQWVFLHKVRLILFFVSFLLFKAASSQAKLPIYEIIGQGI